MPLQAISTETRGYERIVVRPDRSVVIRHRIVADFALRNGANSPIAEALRARQRICDTDGIGGIGYAGEERMPGVGGPYPAWFLGSIQGQGIGADLLTPEAFVKPPS